MADERWHVATAAATAPRDEADGILATADSTPQSPRYPSRAGLFSAVDIVPTSPVSPVSPLGFALCGGEPQLSFVQDSAAAVSAAARAASALAATASASATTTATTCVAWHGARG